MTVAYEVNIYFFLNKNKIKKEINVYGFIKLLNTLNFYTEMLKNKIYKFKNI